MTPTFADLMQGCRHGLHTAEALIIVDQLNIHIRVVCTFSFQFFSCFDIHETKNNDDLNVAFKKKIKMFRQRYFNS